MSHQSEVGERALLPLVFELPTADTSYVQAIVGASEGIKAGGIYKYVEVKVRLRGCHASGGDTLYWRCCDVDQSDIVPVVGFKIIGFQGQSLHAKTVILRDERFSGSGVGYALADSSCNVLGQFSIGGLIGVNLDKISHQDSEAGCLVELIPEGAALLF